MKRTVFGGLALCLAAAFAVYLGDALDLGLPNPLLGISIGGVLALAPGLHRVARLVGFIIGGGLALVGYGLNAQFMPQNSAGISLTAIFTIGLGTAAAALSFGRIPLWSVLLGIAGFTGAYDYTYSDKPYDFLNSAVASPVGMLVVFGIGYVTGALIDMFFPDEVDKEVVLHHDEAETVGSEI
jgi:hypothetical protein